MVSEVCSEVVVERRCMFPSEDGSFRVCKLGRVVENGVSVVGSELCDMLLKLDLRSRVGLSAAPHDCPNFLEYWFRLKGQYVPVQR